MGCVVEIDIIVVMCVIQVRRVLRPGGLLIIREHDCFPERLALVLDVQACVWACVALENARSKCRLRLEQSNRTSIVCCV